MNIISVRWLCGIIILEVMHWVRQTVWCAHSQNINVLESYEAVHHLSFHDASASTTTLDWTLTTREARQFYPNGGCGRLNFLAVCLKYFVKPSTHVVDSYDL